MSRSVRGLLKRVLPVAWASPTTVIGLLPACAGLVFGGRVRLRCGVIEAYGPLQKWLLTHATPLRGGALAMALGHVIIGCSDAALDVCREHELVHVRQAERWGPLFIPAYLSIGAWILLRGGRPYREHPFEREANQSAGV